MNRLNKDLREKIAARREQEARDIEAAKAALAEKHGLERNAKFDRAWELAWGWGHSSGIEEVKGYFDELADLLR